MWKTTSEALSWGDMTAGCDFQTASDSFFLAVPCGR